MCVHVCMWMQAEKKKRRMCVRVRASAHVLVCVFGLERKPGGLWVRGGRKKKKKKEGGYKNGYLACRSGSHVSLLIPLFLFCLSKLCPSLCIWVPWDFSSSDWEILQAVITESRCIGGLFVLDETGFMFQKMSACWCIKLFCGVTCRSNLRWINQARGWLHSARLRVEVKIYWGLSHNGCLASQLSAVCFCHNDFEGHLWERR